MSYWAPVEEIDPVTMEHLLEHGEEMGTSAVNETRSEEQGTRRRFRCGCVLVREGGAVHMCAYHEGFDQGVGRMRELSV